jgi:hypothetical protein
MADAPETSLRPVARSAEGDVTRMASLPLTGALPLNVVRPVKRPADLALRRVHFVLYPAQDRQDE